MNILKKLFLAALIAGISGSNIWAMQPEDHEPDLKRRKVEKVEAVGTDSSEQAEQTQEAPSNPEAAASMAVVPTNTSVTPKRSYDEMSQVVQESVQEVERKDPFIACPEHIIVFILSKLDLKCYTKPCMQVAHTCKRFRTILNEIFNDELGNNTAEMLKCIADGNVMLNCHIVGLAIDISESEQIKDDNVKEMAQHVINKSMYDFFKEKSDGDDDSDDDSDDAAPTHAFTTRGDLDQAHVLELFDLAVKKEATKVIGFLLELSNWDGFINKPFSVLRKKRSNACFLALMDRKEAMARFFLRSGFEPVGGCLFVAVLNGWLDMAMELIEAGVNKKETDEGGKNVIHYAASVSNSTNFLELFLSYSEFVQIINQVDKDCKTPLHLAVCGKKHAIVQMLIENGADICIGSSTGQNILSYAAIKGNPEIVKTLLAHKDHKMILNGRDRLTQMTPLIYVVIQVNERYAAKQDFEPHLAVVRLLVDAGADLNVQDFTSFSALHYAAKAGNEPVVRILLNGNTDATLTTRRGGSTALSFAIAAGMSAEIKDLLKAKMKQQAK